MNPSISNDRVRDIVKTVNGIAPDINGEVTTTAGNVDVSATIGVSDTDTAGVIVGTQS